MKLPRIVIPRRHDEASAERLAEQFRLLRNELEEATLLSRSKGMYLQVMTPKDGQSFNAGELAHVSLRVGATFVMSLSFNDDGKVGWFSDLKRCEGAVPYSSWRRGANAILYCMYDEYDRLAKEAAKRRKILKRLLPKK